MKRKSAHFSRSVASAVARHLIDRPRKGALIEDLVEHVSDHVHAVESALRDFERKRRAFRQPDGRWFWLRKEGRLVQEILDS